MASSATAMMRDLLDGADAQLRLGEAGVAEAGRRTSQARNLYDVVRHDDAGCGLRSRFRDLQMRIADDVRELDARDIRGRILGALDRLGGGVTSAEVSREVAARIAYAKEARVQMMHCLGKDCVLSWPDHHAGYEIAAELRRMRREGAVRSSVPLAFWRGRLWSRPMRETPLATSRDRG